MLPRVAPLAVFITPLCVTSLAGSHRLETAKGLRLELSDEGRVAGISIGTSVLPLRGNGGLAIADFKYQPAPVNLVPNAGFEDGATGWRLAKGQSLDSSVAHSGTTSARLEVAGPETASRATTRRPGNNLGSRALGSGRSSCRSTQRRIRHGITSPMPAASRVRATARPLPDWKHKISRARTAENSGE